MKEVLYLNNRRDVCKQAAFIYSVIINILFYVLEFTPKIAL